MLGSLVRDAGKLGVEHRFLLLDEPGKETVDLIERAGLSAERYEAVEQETQARFLAADVIQLEFWNHPLIYKFLVAHQAEMAVRPAVLHCHIQGSSPPQVLPAAVLGCFDHIVTTTPSTLDTPSLRSVTSDGKSYIPSGLSTSIEDSSEARHGREGPIRAGYVGTLEFMKLHPEAIEICDRICDRDPSLEISFYGAGADAEFRAALDNCRHRDRVRYRGYTSDVGQTLRDLDMFFYPLRPGHYGTGEQALLEAMASGLPVVAMQGPAEAAIIEPGVSGLLCRTTEEVVDAMLTLAADGTLRRSLGHSAAERVAAEFSPQRARHRFFNLYQALASGREAPRKRPRLAVDAHDLQQGASLFVLSQGSAAEPFLAALSDRPDVREPAIRYLSGERNAYGSRTRGTPAHYLHYFPGDAVLQFWASLFQA